MPQQTKTFRVFVSSTFADMKEERRILQNEVFPRLEKLCEQKGTRFQAVDLRWGVNEASQLDQKTIDICLGEINRCQRLSPKPNFIALLGDRYGWQPVPAKIPANEMTELIKMLSPADKKLVDLWYKIDENALQAVYVLQPRGKAYREFSDWEKVEVKLRKIIREAVSGVVLSTAEQVKYFASATHLEIINGALNPPIETGKPEEHVFAYSRTINGLPLDKTARDFLDIDGERQDDYSRTKLKSLKEELKNKLGSHYFEYEADWRNGSSLIREPLAFSDRVYNDLASIINDQLREIISTDEIESEIRIHNEFKENLTQYFCGRQETINTIKNYISGSSESKVLSVIGKSGSGKSSVIAKAIEVTDIENSNTYFVYRFIGTSSRSSNILSLLLSLSGQIAGEFGVTLESLAGIGNEKALYEVQGLTDVFAKCLSLGSINKKIAIFLDALDQLSESENPNSFNWLPKKLPAHVKIVVSSLPEMEYKLNDSEILQLPVLPEAEAIQILGKWFVSIKRRLTDKQNKELLSKFNRTGLSIYLKLAFESARHWHSYDTSYNLQPDVKGIINDFFQYLEKEHTEDLVRTVISYMLCGKYHGLTENEILEILFFDKEYKEIFLQNTHENHRKEIESATKIPIVVWSRLYLDLQPFLTERDADGVTVITFFHRTFIEVLKERYNLDAEIVEN
jgi:hypothetical protein